MQKRKVVSAPQCDAGAKDGWLDLNALADVEISSEDPAHPIEGALVPGYDSGWRAGEPGRQLIRLLFPQPQSVGRIRLQFEEKDVARTQEYVLRWAPQPGAPCREIVRQQWNFNPQGATVEVEVHEIDLPPIAVLELVIEPDPNNPAAVASLECMQLGPG